MPEDHREPELTAAHHDAELRWNLGVPFAAFTAWVAARPDARAEHLAELALSCAVAKNCVNALTTLETWCAAELNAVFRHARSADRDEWLQRLRTRLVVAPAGTRPLIDDYGGKGSLRGWLRMLARSELARIEAQTHQNEEPLLGAAEWALVSGQTDLRVLRAADGAKFLEALRAAAASLEPRERTLLRFSFIDNLSVEGIGSIYGVHKATAARWVAGARHKLMHETRTRLASQLRLDPAEFTSLIRALRSHVQFSLSKVLDEC